MPHPELVNFMKHWTQDENSVKPVFTSIYRCLTELGAILDYKGRPGVSHSVRARHSSQKRELFVLVDVIDDDPAARWLSICFYADLVQDPDEKGDIVPGGLKGEDARCFDVDTPDVSEYMLTRLREAFIAAERE